MGNLLLKVKDLNVFYGDAQALWDVSFEVQEGEGFSIIGSNGAGKSTILKTLCGLKRPNPGQIEFLGSRVEGQRPNVMVDLGISLVPEGRGLFSKLTVLENLELGAFTKRARASMKGTLEWVSELFPIVQSRKSQVTGKMSGGEQQMVAIGRALMSRPKLLMLDEPSLGLAPIVVRTVFEIIRTLHEQKVTILLVEQNVRQSLDLAHRAFVLENGKIVLSGTGKELLKDDRVRKAYLGL